MTAVFILYETTCNIENTICAARQVAFCELWGYLGENTIQIKELF